MDTERERRREREKERDSFNNLSDVLNASRPIMERNLLEKLQQIFPVKTSAAFWELKCWGITLYIHIRYGRSRFIPNSWEHLVCITSTIVLHSVVSANLLDTVFYFMLYCLFKNFSFHWTLQPKVYESQGSIILSLFAEYQQHIL